MKDLVSRGMTNVFLGLALSGWMAGIAARPIAAASPISERTDKLVALIQKNLDGYDYEFVRQTSRYFFQDTGPDSRDAQRRVISRKITSDYLGNFHFQVELERSRSLQEMLTGKGVEGAPPFKDKEIIEIFNASKLAGTDFAAVKLYGDQESLKYYLIYRPALKSLKVVEAGLTFNDLKEAGAIVPEDEIIRAAEAAMNNIAAKKNAQRAVERAQDEAERIRQLLRSAK